MPSPVHRRRSALVVVGVAFLLGACAPANPSTPAVPATSGVSATSEAPMTSVEPEAGMSEPTSGPGVVAVGDSFASGVGAPAAEGSCGRSERGWTGLVARGLGRPFLNLACGGATLDEIAAQVGLIPEEATLVLMSGGGIDAGSAELMGRCRQGDCTGDAAEFVARFPQVKEKLIAVVRRAATGRRLVLVAYPAGLRGVCDNIGEKELQTINAASGVLLEVMRESVDVVAAEGYDVVFANAAALEGQTFCPGQEPLLYGPSSLLFLHLNERGHEEVAQIVSDLVR